MQISISDVGKFVGGCVNLLGAKFSLANAAVSEEDFKTPRGLLPMVLWHADRLNEFALARGMGIDFKPNKSALLGYEVNRVVNVSVSKHYPIILEGIVQMVETLPKDEAGAIKLDEMASIFSVEVANEADRYSAQRTTA